MKQRQKQVKNNQPGQNEELVPKRGTTSVALSRVFKHCSFKTTDFKPLKLKQQTYMRVPSLSVWEEHAFSFLPTLNNYINTLVCVRIPVFASILIVTNPVVLPAYWLLRHTDCCFILDCISHNPLHWSSNCHNHMLHWSHSCHTITWEPLHTPYKRHWFPFTDRQVLFSV